MRVLTVRGEPFGSISDEAERVARQLNEAVLANYGHAGPAFARSGAS